MGAFGKLPFQFQQRGDVLAQAVARQDHKVLSQHLTKRDQDLEDYLANLHGGGFTMSQAVWTAPTVNGGSADLLTPGASNPDWSFAGNTGGFDGGGVFHGAGPAIVSFLLSVQTNYSTATTDGFVKVQFTGPFATDNRTLVIDHTDPLASWSFQQEAVEMATTVDGLPTDPTGSTPIVCTRANLGIAGLTGPDALTFQGAILYVFVALSAG